MRVYGKAEYEAIKKRKVSDITVEELIDILEYRFVPHIHMLAQALANVREQIISLTDNKVQRP